MILRFANTEFSPRVRSGMSMAEVLVALFLMALGSIAILTMFPLGMYHMGQALKDDRTAQCAAQADAFMRSYWRMAVVQGGSAGEPFVTAMDDPNSPDQGGPLPLRPVAFVPGPSFPVFVDPMGFVTPWGSQNNSFQKDWVAYPGSTSNPPFLPRRSLNVFFPPPNLLNTRLDPQRTCSLMDGYGYAENGTANNLGGSSIERELRYNWLWVLQRPDNTVRNVASMTVVVFDKRAYQYAPSGAESSYTWDGTPSPSAANLVSFVPLTTSISIPKSMGVPQIPKGGWVMDGSNVPAQGIRHAIFYRVVSVTDNPNNPSLGVPTTDIELQTPIRRLDGSTNQYFGTLVYLASVSEVFERPNLTPNDF